MSSIFGEAVKVCVWGESHASAIGVVIDGIPSGEKIDVDALQRYCDRRRSNGEVFATPRKEADVIKIQSGILNGYTTGAPISVIVENTNTVSSDYNSVKNIPRPSHADYPAFVKYQGYNDVRGGGQFSGRLTLPLVIAGGIAAQTLMRRRIRVSAYISEIHGIKGVSYLDGIDCKSITDYGLTDEMISAIDAARKQGDSVGGVIECVAIGMPVGLGEPIYDSMESAISRILFGIPAVKGVEFGLGFGYSGIKGSDANDAYEVRDGKIATLSNNNGGIVGGLTDGAPVTLRVALKPTPSIAVRQRSVDLTEMRNTELEIRGRHDACIAPRAVVVVESAVNIAVLDKILQNSARK